MADSELRSENSNELELIEIGGHFGRRTGKSPIAVSKCHFDVRDEAQIANCRDALVQFEQHLRKREAASVRYEWASIVRRGTRFALDILWYDRKYFSDRKGAYLVGAHPLAVARFGCRPNDLTVEHFATDQ